MTGPFEKYDQLVSPDEELHMEVTRVSVGWSYELDGMPTPHPETFIRVLLQHGWKIYRQTGHNGYEEIDHEK